MVNYLDEKRWKANLIDYDVWSTLELAPEDDPQTDMICITPQEAAILIAGITAYRWRTRWLNAPESFDMADTIDQLEAKLTCNSGCCDTVLHCIQNSEAIQDAIRDASGGDKGEPLNAGVPSLDGCDPDIVFGAVSELVRYMNRAITDAFEQIELATNSVELIAEWLDNVPLVGGAWAALPEFVAFVQDSLKEAYDAGYTVAIEDEIRCDYFCLYLENCSITPQQLFEYHFNKLSLPPVVDIYDLLLLAINQTWTGNLAVHVSYAIAYGFLWLGDALNDSIPFLSIDTVRSIKIPLAIGANTPDSTWDILCADCPQAWCIEYDFTTGSQHGWIPSVIAGETRAVYNGFGYVSPDAPVFTIDAITIEKGITGATITDIEIYYGGTIDPDTQGGYQEVDPEEPSVLLPLATQLTFNDINISPDTLRIRARYTTDNNIKINAVIEKVVIYGVGNQPAEGTPCP